MRIGAVFPQTEAGKDFGAIKDYAQALESMGLDHILDFDHILGANTRSRPEWKGTYQLKDSFYEPFVLFSYIAGITKKIELGIGVAVASIPFQSTIIEKHFTLKRSDGGVDSKFSIEPDEMKIPTIGITSLSSQSVSRHIPILFPNFFADKA